MANVSGFPALDGLSDEEILALYGLATQKRLKTGERLLEQGGPAGSAFLILDGTLEVRRKETQSECTLATLRSGEWAGACRLPEEQGAPAALVACSETAVLEMGHEGLTSIPGHLKRIAFERLTGYPKIIAQGLARRQAALAARSRYLVEIAAQSCNGAQDYASVRQINATIDNMPSLPTFAHRLLGLLNDEEASAKEVVEVTKEDPSLVASILKEVNSAAYGLSNQVSDLRHAITLLGFQQVHQLVLKEGISKVMPDKPEFHALQDHCIGVSHMVFEISRLSGERRHATISTIGLLHDLGRCLALLLEEEHPDLVFFIGQLDHAKLGTVLLKRWNIPETVWRPISLQHAPEYMAPADLPDECRRAVAMLYLAHRADDLLTDENAEDREGDFAPEYLALLGIDAQSISELVNRHIVPALSKTKRHFEVRV